MGKRIFTTKRSGFTIVELLIVIVVIAILAAVTIVAYNGISTQAKESALKSDLETAAKQIQLAKAESGAYPANTSDIKIADTTTLLYTHDNNAHTFCLEATSSTLPGKTYFITDGAAVTEGTCPPPSIADGSFMQTITSANCPAEKIRAVDARDNHSYWIQKLGDGKCWMLTNLAYAGGGANTYGDMIPTGTAAIGSPKGTFPTSNDNAGSATAILPKYYIPAGSNVTSGTTNPSTTTNGGATNPQYGLLYNYCAANAGQSATGACSASSSVAVDTAASVCPSGWRLPTGSTGEFMALNTAINGGSTSSPSGLLTNAYFQYSGRWLASFFNQGSSGYYWSSTQISNPNAYALYFSGPGVMPAYSYAKNSGYAVRCLAN